MNQRPPGDDDVPSDDEQDDDEQADQEALQKFGREAMRFSGRKSAPMPAEATRNFRGTVRQLGKITGRETPVLILVIALAVMSVSLTVIGPWLLGGATDIIVSGVRQGSIDTAQLRDRLLTIAGVFGAAWALGYAQTYLFTGALQRSMFRLRETIEAKLHRLPLSYVDRHARGDLLSRVTNDIDNLTQSLQQTINQILTSLLTLVLTAAHWWWHGYRNPGGVTPTVSLPLAAAASSAIIALRFAAGAETVDTFNRQESAQSAQSVQSAESVQTAQSAPAGQSAQLAQDAPSSPGSALSEGRAEGRTEGRSGQ